ncbi:MAG: transporter substrate-binding domain-containing protein [Nitrosarchaeum sp.]|nr:transporter substrate-binding domain-containing protein [Nitrosarchaeum sp.]
MPALLAGQVDISLKHTLTPQRAFEVEFTQDNLLCETGRIVVRRSRDWQQEQELNQPQRVIAVSPGASQEIHARRRYPLAQVRFFSTAQAALEAVALGEADACLHDTLVPTFFTFVHRLHCADPSRRPAGCTLSGLRASLYQAGGSALFELAQQLDGFSQSCRSF